MVSPAFFGCCVSAFEALEPWGKGTQFGKKERAFTLWLLCESMWVVEKQIGSSGEQHTDMPITDHRAQSGSTKGGLSAMFY